MKKSKKFLAVLSTSAMLATVGAPAVLPGVANTAFASGSGTVSATTVPSVSTTGTINPGSIRIVIPKYTLDNTNPNNLVTLTLPQGLKFLNSTPTVSVSGDVYAQEMNPNAQDSVTLTPINDHQVKLSISPNENTNLDDSIISVSFPSGLKADGLSAGPVNVTLDAPSNSPFPVGSVTIANAQSSNGTVDLAVTDSQSSNTDFYVTLKVSEELAGALSSNSDGLKIKLPNGFEWANKWGNTATLLTGDQSYIDDQTDNQAVLSPLYGTVAGNVYVKDDKDTLHIYTATPTTGNNAAGFNLRLHFKVVDESLINNPGAVVATVSGSDIVNTTQLTVGTYGQYGGSIAVASTPTIVAGQKNQQIGDITIKENVAGSFIDGRTIDLTLPSGARWEDEFENGPTTPNVTAANVTETNGLTPPSYSFIGSDHRTLRITVHGKSTTNPGEIDLKNVKVAVAPDFSGDLNVTVSGSQGLTGTAKVATVQPAVTLSASTKPNVIIGAAGQQIGDITLTESVAGALTRDSALSQNQVVLHLPDGVQWDGTPQVQVTNGDLNIDQSSVAVTNNNQDLVFNINGTSTTPSTVTIKGAKLTVDRTVPYGDVVLKVKGSAAAYTAAAVTGSGNEYPNGDNADWQQNDTTAAKAAIATVATPAPGDTTGKAVFTIGSTSYTLNGQTATADVAPYIKNGRTYLPVTYVAQALGVSLQNIVWNNAERSVTIFNGSRVVKMVIGSNVLNVNGVQYTMDTAPEISSNRTMLPVAYLATALGVPYSWDATTQTVTFGQ